MFKKLVVGALATGIALTGGASTFAADQSTQSEQKMSSGIIYLDKSKSNQLITTLAPEDEKSKLIATITSEARPQSGQKNRSSGNFAIQTLPSGTYALRWSAPSGVFFNVMRDVSVGKDPVVFSTVSDGTTTSYPTSRAYYIANPSGADSDFNVSVYALYR
ncbi:hypothetical protein [Bacillus toyonensis]|uniref:hypothetical protein n=1 Tax=Bacillus toyonensis TaxID=155322 RepID=UPI0020D27F02|nr:hypothetical protein [Bacillus toyonensis]